MRFGLGSLKICEIATKKPAYNCLLSTSQEKCSIFLKKTLCILVYPYTIKMSLTNMKICKRAAKKLTYICLLSTSQEKCAIFLRKKLCIPVYHEI